MKMDCDYCCVGYHVNALRLKEWRYVIVCIVSEAGVISVMNLIL